MKPSPRYTQTPEEKAATVRQLEPVHYMKTVDGIIEALEFIMKKSFVSRSKKI